MTPSFKGCPQCQMILDDAIVDHGHRARRMRMGILFAGPPVGRPSRVPNADAAGDGLFLNQLIQIHQFTNGAGHAGFAAVIDGQARRVIPAVFEALQAFQQNARAFSLPDITDDPAHD